MRAILTWHSVDSSRSVVSVPPRRFAKQVRWLASGAVAVVPVAELFSRTERGPTVALTFDDGFANFAAVAWPLLRDHGLPVTLFIPTSRVGGTNRWGAMPGGAMPTLPLMDWETLGRLAEEGVELGAHGRTHADLTGVSDCQLEDEVAGSVEDLTRQTGRRPDGFAYPYGRCDDRVVAAARRACGWACTTTLGPVHEGDDFHRLPRLDTYFLRGPGRLASFGSRGFRWYLAVRAEVRRLRRR